jgi:hypothetical protein
MQGGHITHPDRYRYPVLRAVGKPHLYDTFADRLTYEHDLIGTDG